MNTRILRSEALGHTPWVWLPLVAACWAGSLCAQDEQRVWRDKTGKFEVTAKLTKQEEDHVQLLKADGRLITVPLNALSDADRQYLSERAAAMAANPFAGGVPTGDIQTQDVPSGPANQELLSASASPSELPTTSEAIFLASEEPVPPVEADPATQAELSRFVQPLPKFDAYAKLSKPILLNQEVGTVAISAHRVGNAVSNETFGRIFVYDPKQKRPTIALDIQQTLKIFDHHSASDKTLAVLGLDSNSERGGDLVLLQGLGGGKVSALGRWHLPGWEKPGFKPKVEFARLLDASRALVQVNDTAYIWNLQESSISYRIDRIPAGAKLAVSGTGKYVAIPQSKGCRLVDPQSGVSLGNYTFTASLTPEAKFSPDGSQLALAAGNQVVVWDLTTSDISQELTLGLSNGRFYGWLNDHMLMMQLGGLVDLDLGMSIWKYSISPAQEALLLDGGIVLAAKSTESYVAAIKVPHNSVQKSTQRLTSKSNSMLAVGPGSRVSLKVNAIAGVNQQAMESALKKAVEKAGWTVSPQAPIQVTANIERGKKQTLYFRTLGSPRSDRGEEVSIRPYTASVSIRQGPAELWSRKSTNMVPSFIRLESGQSLQQAVKQYEKADPGFFERLTIPPKILSPEFAQNIGSSRLKNGQWVDY